MMGIFSGEENLIIKEYSKNPINNHEMKDYTVKYHEGNFICGDDVTVFLLIDKKKITNYSYIGNLSTVSLAVSSLISEFIIGLDIEDLLKWDYNFIKNKGIVVSNKRKRASVLTILALRNAIHQYLNDGKIDDFDDIIDD